MLGGCDGAIALPASGWIPNPAEHRTTDRSAGFLFARKGNQNGFGCEADRLSLRHGATGVAGARLRAGIRITVLALVLVVVSALSGWWPKPADTADTVSVTDSAGQTWCGPLTSAPPGTVGVHTAQQVVNVPLQTVAQIQAVSGCP